MFVRLRSLPHRNATFSRVATAWASSTPTSTKSHGQNPDNQEQQAKTCSATETCPQQQQREQVEAKQEPIFCADARDRRLLLYHLESTTSTQEDAKVLVETNNSGNQESKAPTLPSVEPLSLGEVTDNQVCFAVTATSQSKGRGTNGRIWMAPRGNAIVTIGIQQSAWSEKTGLLLTLLPLKLATIVAQRVEELLDSELDDSSSLPRPHVTVKWPNDVLVNREKIAGVLIETARDKNNNYWMLVGIGVNVGYTPLVPTSGPNNGRRATSIRQLVYEQTKGKKAEEYHKEENEVFAEAYVDMARQLGTDLAYEVSDFMWSSTLSRKLESQERILKEWKEWVDWDMELVLRDGDDKVPVVPVDVHSDGRLIVRGRNGVEKTVVADYFL